MPGQKGSELNIFPISHYLDRIVQNTGKETHGSSWKTAFRGNISTIVFYRAACETGDKAGDLKAYSFIDHYGYRAVHIYDAAAFERGIEAFKIRRASEMAILLTQNW